MRGERSHQLRARQEDAHELLARRPEAELIPALLGQEPRRARWTLPSLIEAGRRAGITRLGRIGGFADEGLEVVQTCRPNLWQHSAVGMNTGSQGKGYALRQAKISAVMEGLEAYCSEPRNPRLIRGRYDELSQVHPILPPAQLVHAEGGGPLTDEDVLMWTSCLLWPSLREVLVPAELVYCIFHQSSYGCASRLSCNSSGTAGAFSYTDALLHGLYEYVERHYIYFLERQEVRAEALKLDGPVVDAMMAHSMDFLSEYTVQLYAISVPGFPSQLPFVYCEIGNAETYSVGYGLSLSPEEAMRRAHSEAFQTLVTISSGARDDLREESLPTLEEKRADWPTRRTLGFSEFSRRFATLRTAARRPKDALARLMRWVQALGYPEICFANLTRYGIEVPMIKAYVPGMRLCDKYRAVAPSGWSFDHVVAEQFLIGGPR